MTTRQCGCPQSGHYVRCPDAPRDSYLGPAAKPGRPCGGCGRSYAAGHVVNCPALDSPEMPGPGHDAQTRPTTADFPRLMADALPRPHPVDLMDLDYFEPARIWPFMALGVVVLALTFLGGVLVGRVL